MNAEQFCLEHSKELLSGKIVFSKRTKDRFIKDYTYFTPKDFTKEAYKRLGFLMIELYYKGFKLANEKDYHIEKIELSAFITDQLI